MAGYSDKNFGSDGSVTHHRHAGLFTAFTVRFTSRNLEAEFPAILQDFSDDFASDWSTEQYYGRMDPVARFKSTKRTINFTITVIADEASDAVTNMAKMQKLQKMLYPTYRASPDAAVNGGNASLINSAPLIGIQMGNLVRDTKTGGALMGYVDGFEFRPDNEATWFLADGLDNADRRAINKKGKMEEWGEATFSVTEKLYIPSKFVVGVSFNVLHQHSLGWSENGEWMGGSEVATGGESWDYPYNMEHLSEAMPDDLKEKVIIQRTSKLVPKAPIVKTVKQGLLSKLFFGPD